jgi:hypothetical protein
MSGGTKLIWLGRTFINDGKGTLSARLKRIIGDISGDYGKSILVLNNAADWPAGTALKGQTIIAGFCRGDRREAYTIDKIEHKGNETWVYLENYPFFIDHRGEVTHKLSDPGNCFLGSGTGKGGMATRYLSGSKVVFPDLKKYFTLDRPFGYNGGSNNWMLKEKVNLAVEGVKVGTRFEIHPDYQDAIVEVMTITNKEL